MVVEEPSHDLIIPSFNNQVLRLTLKRICSKPVGHSVFESSRKGYPWSRILYAVIGAAFMGGYSDVLYHCRWAACDAALRLFRHRRGLVLPGPRRLETYF